MQDCETGACWTKDDGKVGNFGQDPFVEHEVELFTKASPPSTNSCRGCDVGSHKIILDNIDAYPFASVNKNPLGFSTRDAVDMSKCSAAAGKNYLGWPSDSKYFWKNYYDSYGALSPKNKARVKLIIEGKYTKVPEVDAQWIAKQPGEALAKMFEPIEHHHLNYGRYAIPRARSLHRYGQWHSLLHPKLANSAVFTKREKGMAAHGKTIIGRLSIFYDIYDAITASFNEDPLATYNIIYTDNGGTIVEPLTLFKAGRLYWRQSNDTFIYVTSRSTSGMYYEVYESHGYDGYEKKYIGVGKMSGPTWCTFVGTPTGRTISIPE
jgi:hypothetical protein